MSEAELVELMIGRPFDTAFPERVGMSGDEGEALSLIALQGKFFGPLSLTVKRGEILGVAGVEGNGQGDFFQTLSGRIPPKRGIVKCNGQHADLTSPIGALHSGIMLLAGDRKNESLFPVLGVRSNATIQVLKRFSRFGLIRRQLEQEAVKEMAGNLKIRTPSLEQPVQFLSGGNQQKVALARTSLRADVAVVLADEPTQGVDASSRLDIYEALHAKAAQGAGIIIKSSDPIELSGLCDRVIVMSRGQIVNELTGDDLTERHIIEAIVGGVNISIDVVMPDVGKSIADLTGENAAKESK
jgi:ribose transport system ATP-binding protein